MPTSENVFKVFENILDVDDRTKGKSAPLRHRFIDSQSVSKNELNFR